MRARLLFLTGIALTAIFAAACSVNGSGYTPAPPTSESTTASFSTTSTTPVSFAKLSNGLGGSITLPEANADATATLTLSNRLPSGAAAPTAAAVHRMVSSSNGVTVLAAVSLSVGTTIAVSQTPAFAITLPSAPSSSVYVLFEDETQPAAGWSTLLGPGTASGTTISFAAQSIVPPITFTTGHTYVFALVESSTAPTTNGVTYGGTKTVNYTYGYDFGYPTPGPTATAPPTTLSYTVSTNITLGASPFPSAAPTAGLLDVHVAENDASSLSTTSYTTDEWANATSTSGTYDVGIYGTEEQEPSSADLPVYTTVYNNPQIIDEYPETNGASWTNSPAATQNYSFADGDTGVRTTASDGSYTDTEQIFGSLGGQPAILTENSDGSGSITGPYYGGGIIDSLAFSAPASGQVTLTISYSSFAQTQYGFQPTQTLSEAAFYPVPPTLYSESDKVTTGASIPSSCGSTFGSSGTDVQRSVTTYDTVIGFEETTIMNSYEVGGVPVCLNTTDTLNYAYDEQGTTPYLIDFEELGLEVVTTTETLTLQTAGNAALPGTAGTATAARATVAALETHELASFARARIAAEHTFIKNIRTREAASLKIQGGHR